VRLSRGYPTLNEFDSQIAWPQAQPARIRSLGWYGAKLWEKGCLQQLLCDPVLVRIFLQGSCRSYPAGMSWGSNPCGMLCRRAFDELLQPNTGGDASNSTGLLMFPCMRASCSA